MLACFLLMGFGLPKNIEKKVFKELEKTFAQADVQLKAINVEAELNSKLAKKINGDNFFRVIKGEANLGYVFIDKAPSKTAKFDYLVVFDEDLKIVHSKVLVYREEYGGEIGSTRWLKQFIGKTVGDRVSHETNIDGIAGATISVRSMTSAVDQILQTIGELKENEVL
ncbi:FMN-binding protein [Maribacter sp. TH_r10]|uniref:FMN-binding protein n=1 Tax=Maribacter luteus TaxID=2594478 RepID=A0A6I2MQR5_9FLAO|nr:MULTISPECIES: FMN-binding protein [Maribacter]MDV7139664.1 FMN-binding protein [Maribacter sp. TH_r10]MRX65167.1 FMN-binding protein [Maribacter luteus]